MGKRVVEVPLDGKQVVLVEVSEEDFYQDDALAPVANVEDMLARAGGSVRSAQRYGIDTLGPTRGHLEDRDVATLILGERLPLDEFHLDLNPLPIAARLDQAHLVGALCCVQWAADRGVDHVGTGDDVPVVDDETRPHWLAPVPPLREADQADVGETLRCHHCAPFAITVQAKVKVVKDWPMPALARDSMSS